MKLKAVFLGGDNIWRCSSSWTLVEPRPVRAPEEMTIVDKPGAIAPQVAVILKDTLPSISMTRPNVKHIDSKKLIHIGKSLYVRRRNPFKQRAFFVGGQFQGKLPALDYTFESSGCCK